MVFVFSVVFVLLNVDVFVLIMLMCLFVSVVKLIGLDEWV